MVERQVSNLNVVGSNPTFRLSKRWYSRTFWTGVRFPTLPFMGVSWFRQGVTSMTDDGTEQQMLTTSFLSTAVAFSPLPEMVDQVR